MWNAWRARDDLGPAQARALVGATALAAPMAFLGVVSLAGQALHVTGPVSAGSYLVLASLGVGILILSAWLADRSPPERVWAAAAILPLVAILVASFKAPTTWPFLAALLSLVLLCAAVVLPRAAALAVGDSSRSFAGLVVGLVLLVGAGFGGFLSAAAVQEGGLGLGAVTASWRLEVDGGEAPFEVRVPFLGAPGGHAEAVVESLRSAIQVTSGEGKVRMDNATGEVVVTGQGAVVVTARVGLHAAPEHRDLPGRLEAAPGDAAVVSGGAPVAILIAYETGACPGGFLGEATVSPGETTPLLWSPRPCPAG